MPNYHHPDEDQLRKWQVPLPNVNTHGTEADIDNLRQKLQPHEWVLEGNELKGVTKDGSVLMQRIPTNYILEGNDVDGLPVFREIKL